MSTTETKTTETKPTETTSAVGTKVVLDRNGKPIEVLHYASAGATRQR